MVEVIDKLNRISHQTRQSNRAKNDAEYFVREVLREAKNAHLTDQLAVPEVEALAAEAWLRPLIREQLAYPMDVLTVASQRRNHRLMLRLLRHPDEIMRTAAAEQLQIRFAMLDNYYDEASALINQILLMPTEIPAVKYALLRDLGRTSRRGLPREIADTARRLIHDLDEGVSYHALRLLGTLYDVRDWRVVLDRMISLTSPENTDEVTEYFLAAGVDYLQAIVQFESEIVDWFKSLIDTYPPTHMAMRRLEKFVMNSPDIALEVHLINKEEYQALKG